MLDVLLQCFKDALPGWVARLTEMIPSYGRSIAEDPDLLRHVRAETAATLRLEEPAAVG
jgi:malate dehydrogenase (quinone)